MDKKDVLLFIAERVNQLLLLERVEFAGRITREEQAMYQEAWSFIDPKAKACFTCGRTPEIMARAMLNFYLDHSPKTRKRK
tara:strand:- start:60 stop:302 length:243 start_codon:yes stop_codon:yes gene_type:complete